MAKSSLPELLVALADVWPLWIYSMLPFYYVDPSNGQNGYTFVRQHLTQPTLYQRTYL